jgi:hypothetical protein
VVGLSVIRVPLIWLALATVGAVIALVLATMPKLRPWRSAGQRAAGTRSRHRIGATPVRSTEAAIAASGQAAPVPPVPPVQPAWGPGLNGAAPLLSAPPTMRAGPTTVPTPAGAPGPATGPTVPAGPPPAPFAPPNRPPIAQPNGTPYTSPNGTPNGTQNGTRNSHRATGPLPSRHARNAGATRP